MRDIIRELYKMNLEIQKREREESGTVAIKGNEKEKAEERYCRRDLEREGAISRERREA